MATVGRGAEQYTVRFPDGLRDRIKAVAEANNRSMNAEIVATLEEKYPEPKSGLILMLEDMSRMTALAKESANPDTSIERRAEIAEEIEAAKIDMLRHAEEGGVAFGGGYDPNDPWNK